VEPYLFSWQTLGLLSKFVAAAFWNNRLDLYLSNVQRKVAVLTAFTQSS